MIKRDRGRFDALPAVLPHQTVDREWFEGHPGEDWRVRDREPAEQDEFELLFSPDEMRAADADAARRGLEPCVVAFRVGEGMRARLPGWRTPEGEFREMAFHAAEGLRVMDMTVEGALAAALAEMRRLAKEGEQSGHSGDPKLDGDACARCGTRFRTGDVTWGRHWEGYAMNMACYCDRCRKPNVRYVAVALYLEKGHDPMPPDVELRWRRAQKRLRRIMRKGGR